MSETQVGVDIESLPPGRCGVFLTMRREDALAVAKRWIASIESDRRPYFRDGLVFPKGAIRDHRKTAAEDDVPGKLLGPRG